MKINIVGVRPYEFTDKKTGNEIKGTSLYYIAENPFDEELIGKITGRLSIGAKASANLSTTDLLNSSHCEADFDNNGRLLSLRPIAQAL